MGKFIEVCGVGNGGGAVANLDNRVPPLTLNDVSEFAVHHSVITFFS
jgi:hypothetical protein